MRLRFRIPAVEPDQFATPERCRYSGCDGRAFEVLQRNCTKPLLDAVVPRVQARRVRCLSCGRTFRTYPKGVTRDQQSETTKTLSMALYGLGLSCAATARLLEGLGCFVSKTTVYRNVRAAGSPLQEVRANRPDCLLVLTQVGGSPLRSRADGHAIVARVMINGSAGIELEVMLPDDRAIPEVKDWILQLANVIGLESPSNGRP